MNPAGSRECDRCRSPIPGDAPEGLCPRCLVSLPFDTESDDLAPTEAIAVPAPADLAPYFPQLEILECLGRGGMGVVYKAHQKSLERPVALKLIAPERAGDAAFAARFRREARALAALNHPGIVTIHDHGHAGGYFFLLMEFVDGQNLRQAMQGGPMEATRACAIVAGVCEALEYAHARGVVHRDIKPENLLLTTDGRVKVVDFGIAKILGVAAGSDTAELSLTQPVGSPQYMSPEQRAGRPTDQRADIWSLGVVLHELITGAYPDSADAVGKQAQMADILALVARALDPDPTKRPATTGEFRAALTALTQRQPERRRLPWRLILPVVALLLLTGLACRAWLPSIPHARRPEDHVIARDPLLRTAIGDDWGKAFALFPDATEALPVERAVGKLFFGPAGGTGGDSRESVWFVKSPEEIVEYSVQRGPFLVLGKQIRPLQRIGAGANYLLDDSCPVQFREDRLLRLDRPEAGGHISVFRSGESELHDGVTNTAEEMERLVRLEYAETFANPPMVDRGAELIADRRFIWGGESNLWSNNFVLLRTGAVGGYSCVAERSWRVRGDFLQICNSEGKVQWTLYRKPSAAGPVFYQEVNGPRFLLMLSDARPAIVTPSRTRHDPAKHPAVPELPTGLFKSATREMYWRVRPGWDLCEASEYYMGDWIAEILDAPEPNKLICSTPHGLVFMVHIRSRDELAQYSLSGRLLATLRRIDESAMADHAREGLERHDAMFPERREAAPSPVSGPSPKSAPATPSPAVVPIVRLTSFDKQLSPAEQRMRAIVARWQPEEQKLENAFFAEATAAHRKLRAELETLRRKVTSGSPEAAKLDDHLRRLDALIAAKNRPAAPAGEPRSASGIAMSDLAGKWVWPGKYLVISPDGSCLGNEHDRCQAYFDGDRLVLPWVIHGGRDVNIIDLLGRTRDDTVFRVFDPPNSTRCHATRVDE